MQPNETNATPKFDIITTQNDWFADNQESKMHKCRSRATTILKNLENISPLQIKNAKSQIKKITKGIKREWPALFNKEPKTIYVHCDLDAFYASCEELHNPELKKVPIGVGSLIMLTTSNYEARNYGVKAGMPGYMAKRLCPQLVIVPCDFKKYNFYSEAVMRVLAFYDLEVEVYGVDEACIKFDEIKLKRAFEVWKNGGEAGMSVEDEDFIFTNKVRFVDENFSDSLNEDYENFDYSNSSIETFKFCDTSNIENGNLFNTEQQKFNEQKNHYTEQKINFLEQINNTSEQQKFYDQKNKYVEQKNNYIEQKNNYIEQKNNIEEDQENNYKKQNNTTELKNKIEKQKNHYIEQKNNYIEQINNFDDQINNFDDQENKHVLSECLANKYQNLNNSVLANDKKYNLDKIFIDNTFVFDGKINFKNVSWIVNKIRKVVHRNTGLTISAGISVCRGLAKYASDINKPNGQFNIEKDFELFLKDLKVDKINGIGKYTKTMLDQTLKIKTIGELREKGYLLYLMLKEKTFTHLFRLSFGLISFDAQQTISSFNVTKSKARDVTFKGTDDYVFLCNVLWDAANEIEKNLLDNNYVGFVVSIRVRYLDFKSLTRQRKLERPVNSAIDIYNTAFCLFMEIFGDAKLGYSYLAYIKDRPVNMLGIRVSELIKNNKIDKIYNYKENYEKKITRSCPICEKEFFIEPQISVESHVEKCIFKQKKKRKKKKNRFLAFVKSSNKL
ncbi:hypothetical protein GVAV_002320 [Gurleya vavrai]